MNKDQIAGRVEATRDPVKETVGNPGGQARGAAASSWLAMAVLGLAAVSLAGCERAGEKTAGQQLDSAIAKTEDAAREAKASVQQAAADAKAKVEEKAPAVESAVKEGVAQAKGVAEQASNAIGAAVDDTAISASVSAGLAKDPELSALRIDVQTRAGVVSLKGPAPTEQAKARAEQIARNVNGVTRVDNALEIKPM